MADDIAAQRVLAAQLLTPTPRDALAWYFALEHDPRRTRLYVRSDNSGRPIAFVAICQTGLDLFRPLVVMRGDDSATLQQMLRDALAPNRQYLFNAQPSARPTLEAVCQLHGETVNDIYALNRNDFKPIVNILVQTSKTPDGLLRAVIRARDGSNVAEAGTTWISSQYAEIFVRVVEGARGRGLGKSVVSAISAQVLEMGRTPLYVVGQANVASVRLAERLGYHNTGARELSGAMSRKA
ncbi:MAG: GNAT family N-acetyltransferase [Thermoflexales bacterium]|nr:GNAT family N-acetyltransferase [Thermoflexales bacterium]